MGDGRTPKENFRCVAHPPKGEAQPKCGHVIVRLVMLVLCRYTTPIVSTAPEKAKRKKRMLPDMVKCLFDAVEIFDTLNFMYSCSYCITFPLRVFNGSTIYFSF